jgi:hypothetical protein
MTALPKEYWLAARLIFYIGLGFGLERSGLLNGNLRLLPNVALGDRNKP